MNASGDDRHTQLTSSCACAALQHVAQTKPSCKYLFSSDSLSRDVGSERCSAVNHTSMVSVFLLPIFRSDSPGAPDTQNKKSIARYPSRPNDPLVHDLVQITIIVLGGSICLAYSALANRLPANSFQLRHLRQLPGARNHMRLAPGVV